MSWVDEHWKGVGYGADSGRNCPDFNPNVQSACGQYNARFPDLFMNEEWWGMLAPERGCLAGKPDRLYPRRAFLEVHAPAPTAINARTARLLLYGLPLRAIVRR